MKKHIKLISFTLSIIITLSSLCLVSCGTQGTGERGTQGTGEKIALTVDNVKDYLSIDDEILDYNIEVEYEYLYGFRIPSYDKSYGEAQIVINKKSANLSFEDVEIQLRVSVDANKPYPWKFKNNNWVENYEFNGKVYDTMFENCTYLDLTIPYTGEYSKNLDLVIGRNEDSTAVLDTDQLRNLTIKVISVSGYVIVE